MPGELIRVTWADVAPEHHEDFERWYGEQHVPDLLACPGWHSVTRYRGIEGQPEFLAIYEIGEEAFETPEFKAVAGFGPMTPHILSMSGRSFTRID